MFLSKITWNYISGPEMNSKVSLLLMLDLHFNIFKTLKTLLQKLESCLEMNRLQLSKGKFWFQLYYNLFIFIVSLISLLTKNHPTLVTVSYGLESNLRNDMLIKSNNFSITFLPIKKLHQVIFSKRSDLTTKHGWNHKVSWKLERIWNFVSNKF